MRSSLNPEWKSTQTLVKSRQDDQQTVVFTNGCFDIVHAGHINYLSQARELGDMLIVGLNSDESIERLKGSNRPIQCEQDRQLILQSLSMIDRVIIFDDDTPIPLIEFLKPDIHVKGGDYIASELPEYEVVKSYGGDVQILPFVDGKSSSSIIEKLKLL